MKGDAPNDGALDLAVDRVVVVIQMPPAPVLPPVAGCQVRGDEICNGLDDDCNGQVDDRIAPVPCPGGGQRLCVAGRSSDCPRRCDVCQPGSRRVCQVAFCDFWGVQSCAADGQSFGLCRESRVPAECAAIAKSHKRSADLERCCLDNGYCCLDEFDLDGDGIKTEMLGRCDAVRCGP